VLINKDADRVNTYNVWNYAEGQDFYYASMLVDLTLPPDEVSDLLYFDFLYYSEIRSAAM